VSIKLGRRKYNDSLASKFVDVTHADNNVRTDEVNQVNINDYMNL
jgi:hypothetical protein